MLLARYILFAALTIGAGSAWAGSDMIRVRVLKSAADVRVRGVSLKMEAEEYGWTTEGLTDLRVRHDGTWRLESLKTRDFAAFAGDSTLLIRGAFLQLLGRRVSNEIRVVRSARDGRMDVIVVMPVEEYLAGVIPSEMPVTWPSEALKAQAVAARSFALRSARSRRDQLFDVDSSVLDQVHRFAEDMKLAPRNRSKIQRVISETSGQILLDESDHILRAFYSADCGCVSEDPKYVWGGTDPNFQSVVDPTCGQRRPSTWSFSIQRAELRDRLFRALELGSGAILEALHVGARSPSGRVSTVVAGVETNGRRESRMLTAQDFRRIVGFSKVQSANFTLRWLGDELEIRGEGAGHGVGLCQTGARSLARNGASYHEILKLYYPKAKIKTL